MQIKEICQKYDIDGVYDRFKALSAENIEIGLLGEFSSGKSSLLNSMLAQDILVIDSLPTTKTIISVSFGEDEWFYKMDGSEKTQIDRAEFDSLQREGKHTLFAQLQNSHNDRSDFTYIDTPGISSLDELDYDITFGYLPRLECAIVCQDINQGSLTQSILDFVAKNPAIFPNLVFALTKNDKKSPKAALSIKSEVVQQLKNLALQLDLNTENLDKRVVLTQTNSENKELKTLINEHFYANFKQLRELKTAKIEKTTKKELLDILKDRVANLDYSTDELDAKIKDINLQMEKLKEQIKNEQSKLKTYLSTLEIEIKNKATNCVDLLKNGDSIGFGNEISAVVQRYVEEYFQSNFDEYSGLVDLGKIDEIVQSINFKDKMWNFIPGLVGNAANLIDSVDNALFTANPILGKGAKILKYGLRAIQWGGEAVSGYFVNNNYKNAVDEIATFISYTTNNYVTTLANKSIFNPLRIELENKKDSASDILKAKSGTIESIETLRNNLNADIAVLTKELA